jgi:hypothetical protein
MVKLAESFLADHHVGGSAGERFQVMVHLDQEVLEAEGAWSATVEDGSCDSLFPRKRCAGWPVIAAWWPWAATARG